MTWTGCTRVGAFDLVMCDEAHRLTARRNAITQDLEKTANYRLFEFLVQSRLIRHVENPDLTPRSPRLLLLTGTPHQGDDERFLRLLHLARPDLFQPDERAVADQITREPLAETLTRTPKSRAVDWEGRKLFKGHDTTTIEVPWTPEELEVSRLLTQYILKSLDNARGGDRSFALAMERHGLRLQETRNSTNQFVPDVYHFSLPDAFRDPVFRPERTFHVVFDREVFQRVVTRESATRSTAGLAILLLANIQAN